MSLSFLLHLFLSPSLTLSVVLISVLFSLLELPQLILPTLLYLCIQNSETLQNILKQFCFRVVAWN